VKKGSHAVGVQRQYKSLKHEDHELRLEY